MGKVVVFLEHSKGAQEVPRSIELLSREFTLRACCTMLLRFSYYQVFGKYDPNSARHSQCRGLTTMILLLMFVS